MPHLSGAARCRCISVIGHSQVVSLVPTPGESSARPARLCIPCQDDKSFNIAPAIQRAVSGQLGREGCAECWVQLRAIGRCRAKGGAALVHCNAGVSRSATVVMAALMAAEGLNVEVSVRSFTSRAPHTCTGLHRTYILHETIDCGGVYVHSH